MLKKIIIGEIAIAIGYLPWLGAFLSQSKKVSQKYWISKFKWGEWFMPPATLMESSLVGIGTALYVLVLILMVLSDVKKEWGAIYFLAVFWSTMLIGAVLSVTITPIWQTRYWYVVWGILSLFVTIVVGMQQGVYGILTQSMIILVICLAGFFR